MGNIIIVLDRYKEWNSIPLGTGYAEWEGEMKIGAVYTIIAGIARSAFR